MSPSACIKNTAEFLWEQPDEGHRDGAYSKMLVSPESGAQHIDYRISCYQPKGHVARHKHKVQEQVYHLLQGEGMMEIDGTKKIVRKHDVIFIPPGVEHALHNTGLEDLIFIVATTPARDDQ